MSGKNAYLEMIKEKMRGIEGKFESSTICMAKWTQSTLYLMNGRTHSCHHPDTHVIPLSEIKRSPKALHNTEFKMEKRRQMLAGEQPPECNYCWNIENLGADHVSDRTYKSTNRGWGLPYVDKVLESGDGRDFDPAYLEVAFDNTCNLKCMYCHAEVSSKWQEEGERFGHFKDVSYQIGNIQWMRENGRLPIPQRDHNPYVEAFWEWWPELYKSLDTFRITGGEPLLSKNFWKVLDKIEEDPRADIDLAVNSNLQTPEPLMDKFISRYNAVRPLVKNFIIYTSCEATGPQAEYIRTGLEYDTFLKNVRRLMTETNATVSMMITFNALSLTTFKDFLKQIQELRVEFNKTYQRMHLMINYLRDPNFQTIKVLPNSLRDPYLNDILDYMKSQTMDTNYAWPKTGFGAHEIDQMERLISFANEPITDEQLNIMRADFGGFFAEYDSRRNCDFKKTFPEFAEFYDECLMLTYKRKVNGELL